MEQALLFYILEDNKFCFTATVIIGPLNSSMCTFSYFK